MPDFVSIDGEGLTRSDGTHDYVLLAASDGSYIEEYGSGGLSTADCFEYLLSLGARHHGAILVGFYTSYDVNMIFRDLPASVLEGLWMGNMRTWRAEEGDYKQYRIEYIPNRVLKIRQGCWGMRENDTRARWTTFRQVTWWDCFQFFQMSFVKALRDWSAADDATIDNIASMKDQRGEFVEGQQTAIREYCQDECRLLTGLMGKVADTLEALDINLTSWYGAGSIAGALYKSRGIKKHIKRDWGNERINEAVMRAYFGGRVETFAVGVVEGDCWNYDVRSAYPAATANLPSLDGCEVEETKTYDRTAEYAIWHVKWSASEQPIRLTPFPFRHKKRIFWPHTGEGWYHASEVRAALDVFNFGFTSLYGGTLKIEVIEGYIFRPTTDVKPFDWVPELYAERAEYKRRKDPREKILKLGLNSLYGKTAQSIGGRDGAPPPYQCYLWAGMITADCRAKLLRAAARSDNVLAIATDGLFTSEPVNGLEESYDLGAWESVKVEPGLMLIQPGVYATPSLGKKPGSFAKSRGFSARGINYEKLLEEWRTKRMAGSITIPETRFIGFGYALATNSLETYWRRWIAGTKEIHFSGTSSKSFDPTALMDAELVRLVSPYAPAQISDAYAPRVRGKEAQTEFELMGDLLAAQPDMEDNVFGWR